MKKNKKILVNSLLLIAFKGWAMEGEFNLGEHWEDTTVEDQEQEQAAQRLWESTKREPDGGHLKRHVSDDAFPRSSRGNENSTITTPPVWSIDSAPLVQSEGSGSQLSQADDAAIVQVARDGDQSLTGDSSTSQLTASFADNSAALRVVAALDNPRIDVALERGLWQRFLDWLQSLFGSSTDSLTVFTGTEPTPPTLAAVREAFEKKWAFTSLQELQQRLAVVKDLLLDIAEKKGEIAVSKEPKSILMKREQELTVVEQDLMVERDVLNRFITDKSPIEV